MLYGVAATGVGQVTVITQNYLPQFLYWANGTVLQGIRVDIQGDGNLVNLDAAGINNLRTMNMPGRFANGYYLQLSDGEVQGKVVTVTITNGVAANINIWGFSHSKKGVVYVRSLINACIAAGTTIFKQFRFLGLANSTTVNDIINITYADGHVQQMDPVELAAEAAFYQNDVVAATQGINNRHKKVSQVKFYSAAAQNVYVVDLVAIGNPLNIIP